MQYSLKLRTETAFLLLIIQPNQTIGEIALDCGFSSPAVFSRAMRNHFGCSPGQLRALPHRQRMALLHKSPLPRGSSSRLPLPRSPRVFCYRPAPTGVCSVTIGSSSSFSSTCSPFPFSCSTPVLSTGLPQRRPYLPLMLPIFIPPGCNLS